MIDPTEAPEGMIAVESDPSDLCTGCHFKDTDNCPSDARGRITCVDTERKDRCTVVFIKKPPSQRLRAMEETHNA